MLRKAQGTCPGKVATVASCSEFEHELYEKFIRHGYDKTTNFPSEKLTGLEK